MIRAHDEGASGNPSGASPVADAQPINPSRAANSPNEEDSCFPSRRPLAEQIPELDTLAHLVGELAHAGLPDPLHTRDA